MSAAAERLRSLTPASANNLQPAELYKIIEAAILEQLGDFAEDVRAVVLHRFVCEVTRAWDTCPPHIHANEWFQPRGSDSGTEGLLDFLRRHNYSPASPRSSTNSVSSTASTPEFGNQTPLLNEDDIETDVYTDNESQSDSEDAAVAESRAVEISNRRVLTEELELDETEDDDKLGPASESETDIPELLREALAVLRSDNPALQ